MRIAYNPQTERYEAQITYAERQLAKLEGLQRDPDNCWHTSDVRVAYKLRSLGDPATQEVIDVAIAAKWSADRDIWAELVPHDGARLAQLAVDRQEAERLAFEQAHAAALRAYVPAGRRGRSPKGERAMTSAERMRTWRANHIRSIIEITPEIAARLRDIKAIKGGTNSALMRDALDALEREAAKQRSRDAECQWFSDAVVVQSSVEDCPAN